MFQGRSIGFQEITGCFRKFRDVSGTFQGCSRDLRELHRVFQKLSKCFQGFSNEILEVSGFQDIPEVFQGVSKRYRNVKNVLKGFKCFKKISRGFRRSSIYQGGINKAAGVSWAFQEIYRAYVKGVSRGWFGEYQGCFRETQAGYSWFSELFVAFPRLYLEIFRKSS